MEYIHVFSMECNGISWNVFMERGMFICLNSFFCEYHGIYSSKLGHAPGITWKYK
jgi:hypothetical protein